MNERITEGIVRSMLGENGFLQPGVVIEEQKSTNPRISKLLANASKQGKQAAGFPEWVYIEPL